MKLISTLLRTHSVFNLSGEHVSMFCIEPGEQVEKGDHIVVDTKLFHARKAINGNGFLAVGVASKIIDLSNGNRAVICVDGCSIFYDQEKNITEEDIGKPCYFLDKDNVTLNGNGRTKAGTIVGIELSDDPIDIVDGADRIVWVKTDLVEGSETEC